VTDYKKYALGQLENFLYDAMSAEATPQEIYDTIRDAVQDNLNVYTKSADQAQELLDLLNGHRPVDLSFCDKDDTSEECKKSWENFWQYTDEELNAMCTAAEVEQDLKNVEEFLKKDKVTSWVLPVDDDYNITFPEDLLEQTGWKEGDVLEWIDQGDGSFKIVKKEKKEHPSWVKGNELARVKTYQEMIDDGWTMTDDGFWIKEN
jgi:bifunctional DNA-binding transcriptional regulator/antitoxin component of YhaV-PrlF toxin-antitoxin module